jgi:hypothetical protein
MSRYWERAADRAELESGKLRHEARGSSDRIAQRTAERKADVARSGTTNPGSLSA